MVGKRMKVNFSNAFKRRMLTLDDNMRQAVLSFVAHVRTYGLYGLRGRNKSSMPINPRTKRQQLQYAYTQKYCLWHYHIGIPCYVGEHGDMTSEYILHYQRFDDEIILVGLLPHPPFRLPSKQEML